MLNINEVPPLLVENIGDKIINYRMRIALFVKNRAISETDKIEDGSYEKEN